ncbi:hypothetical protein D3C77_747480 [compost metagenome]
MGYLLIQINRIPPHRQAFGQAHPGEKHELKKSRINLAGPVSVLVQLLNYLVCLVQGERLDLLS